MSVVIRTNHSPDSILLKDGNIQLARQVAAVMGAASGVLFGGMLLSLGDARFTVAGCSVVAVSIVAGVIGLIFKSDVLIDVPAGRVTRRWGLMEAKHAAAVPRPLVEFKAVEHFSRSVAAKNRRVMQYVVGLRSDDGLFTLLIIRERGECRQYAENVAKTLDMPLINGDAADEVRSADWLDASLANSVQVGELPKPPQGMLSQVENLGESLTVTINGPGTDDLYCKSLRRCGSTCVAAMTVVVAVMGISDGDLPETLLLTLLTFGFCAATYLWVVNSTVKERAKQNAMVRLNCEHFEILQVDRFGRETTDTIPLLELEELYHDLRGVDPETQEWMVGLVTDETRITASSDSTVVSFAGWLSRDEKDYLCGVLRQVIARLSSDPIAQRTALDIAMERSEAVGV